MLMNIIPHVQRSTVSPQNTHMSIEVSKHCWCVGSVLRECGNTTLQSSMSVTVPTNQKLVRVVPIVRWDDEKQRGLGYLCGSFDGESVSFVHLPVDVSHSNEEWTSYRMQYYELPYKTNHACPL